MKIIMFLSSYFDGSSSSLFLICLAINIQPFKYLTAFVSTRELTLFHVLFAIDSHTAYAHNLLNCEREEIRFVNKRFIFIGARLCVCMCVFVQAPVPCEERQKGKGAYKCVLKVEWGIASVLGAQCIN